MSHLRPLWDLAVGQINNRSLLWGWFICSTAFLPAVTASELCNFCMCECLFGPLEFSLLRDSSITKCLFYKYNIWWEIILANMMDLIWYDFQDMSVFSTHQKKKTKKKTHLCHPSVNVGEILLLYCTAELWITSWIGTTNNKEQGRLCLALSYIESLVCVCKNNWLRSFHSVQVSGAAFLCYVLRKLAGSCQILGFLKGQAAASLWSVSDSTVRSQTACWCFFFFTLHPPAVLYLDAFCASLRLLMLYLWSSGTARNKC